MAIILKVMGAVILCFIVMYVGMSIQNRLLDEKLTNKFIFRTAFWGTIVAMIIVLLTEELK